MNPKAHQIRKVFTYVCDNLRFMDLVRVHSATDNIWEPIDDFNSEICRLIHGELSVKQ